MGKQGLLETIGHEFLMTLWKEVRSVGGDGIRVGGPGLHRRRGGLRVLHILWSDTMRDKERRLDLGSRKDDSGETVSVGRERGREPLMVAWSQGKRNLEMLSYRPLCPRGHRSQPPRETLDLSWT